MSVSAVASTGCRWSHSSRGCRRSPWQGPRRVRARVVEHELAQETHRGEQVRVLREGFVLVGEPIIAGHLGEEDDGLNRPPGGQRVSWNWCTQCPRSGPGRPPRHRQWSVDASRPDRACRGGRGWRVIAFAPPASRTSARPSQGMCETSSFLVGADVDVPQRGPRPGPGRASWSGRQAPAPVIRPRAPARSGSGPGRRHFREPARLRVKGRRHRGPHPGPWSRHQPSGDRGPAPRRSSRPGAMTRPQRGWSPLPRGRS